MSVSVQVAPRFAPTFTTSHDLIDLKQPADTMDMDANHAPSSDTKSSPPARMSPEPSYAVGTAPDEFYARSLPPWRAVARKFVMQRLQGESAWIAKMQQKVRSPFLDSYFMYTSSLGTHTFFMMGLPCLFFFGYPEIGSGLIFVLATGVYVSSFLKDLICAPRPYTPPVSRLTMGSHHLEYGFPSTHSTNSVSIALYVYSLVHTQYFTAATISTLTYSCFCIFLAIYVCSIVFGRLYTGMHSVVDCVGGVTLGAGVWAAYALWWGSVEGWLVGTTSSNILPDWTSPIIVSLLCGLIVHRHPQPADDCPCFEDAIAFVSVLGGGLISHWACEKVGFGYADLTSHMPGDAWAFLASSSSAAWQASLLWWAVALLKLTSGIALIFVWRLIAKPLLHALLPRLFRWLSYGVLPRLVSINILPKGTELPNRRFYTPATEYDGAVPEEGLHPIPSVIDLSTMLHEQSHYELDGELGGMKRRKGKGRRKSTDLKHLAQKKIVNGGLSQNGASSNNEESSSEDGEDVMHYDADVLTKVIVYAGISIFATSLIPIAFEVLGWGVHP